MGSSKWHLHYNVLNRQNPLLSLSQFWTFFDKNWRHLKSKQKLHHIEGYINCIHTKIHKDPIQGISHNRHFPTPRSGPGLNRSGTGFDRVVYEVPNSVKPHQVSNSAKPHQVSNSAKPHQVSNSAKSHQVSNSAKTDLRVNSMFKTF